MVGGCAVRCPLEALSSCSVAHAVVVVVGVGRASVELSLAIRSRFSSSHLVEKYLEDKAEEEGGGKGGEEEEDEEDEEEEEEEEKDDIDGVGG